MPDISRLAFRDFALAFGLGGGLLVMMLMANVGGLRDLSEATGHALRAFLLMWGLAGMLVAGAMGMADGARPDDDDRPGRRPGRRPQHLLARIRVARERRK